MPQLNFWDHLFPPKYNFYDMITEQAKKTAAGISTFRSWLQNPGPENAYALRSLTREADDVRLEMEARLIDAFVTPFDRQDIYSLSVSMDRIIESAKAIMELMIVYEINTDDAICDMVLNLEEGTQKFHIAVGLLKSDPLEAGKMIGDIRRCQTDVENSYRHGSTVIFENTDMVRVMKFREVYNKIQEAAGYMGTTVDILHKIVVRMV
ncbi:putative phosphate transport regulator [Lucifera butyrica]|uniref:Putative phosphate transport regulator n=1 Tax=Lucifera butyrica TaxID=1351585 RepID=A0A498R9V6_9FIRM|nr:DUF47 family protein [Lucifera butyrica]VBB09476.1 putative phosphate transport regulator [Lucifera butyrica]